MATFIRTDLFFGMRTGDGSAVDPLAFDYFIVDVVVPLFPAGFTLTASTGFWRHVGGETVREPSRVLTILRDAGTGILALRETDGIEAIRNAYKGRFGQESVLRVDATVEGSF